LTRNRMLFYRGSMTKLTDVLTAISQAIHLTKPVLFELVLFLWAVIEMGRFIFTVALGGE